VVEIDGESAAAPSFIRRTSSIARRLSSWPSCHKYDCRGDKCVWLDFDKMIPAPMPDVSSNAPVAMAEVALKHSMQAKEE
jgi:hypothetical protein